MNSALIYLLLIAGALLAALALPPALKQKSWKTFFAALGLSFFGVLLPLFVFLFSAFLVPEWKGGCRHGWLDCFHLGKLALTPLVLAATTALYALDIYRVANRTRQWIVMGIFLGAIIASVCFVFGIVTTGGQPGAALWLLVPFYVSVWYGIRAGQLAKTAGFGVAPYLRAFSCSLPFWLAGWFWSRYTYASLPDQPPSCFVVTATARGHESIVGPFFEINHGGRIRRANRQLITLWHFEALWRAHAPLSHALFRRAYNRLGPAVAGRITSPGMADLAHLAIKPVELLAALAVKGAARGKRKASS
jgi:hypothetical protein